MSYAYLELNNLGGNPITFKAYNMRLYRCTILEGNNVVRDYLPCYNKTIDKAGLYETLHNEVFYSIGPEDFLKGPVVN